ncbi:MAG: GntR family transcriptional regulator [Tateyamaria sp.]|uniref:GntR family transcriptional regulator n=1 Tax=Tateyamaria sp. TaxID=1929288 RepID=UPI00329B7050
MTTPDMSQSETAYAKRRDAIHTGAYVLGTRLYETDVAETLNNWSRMLVREALHRLEADHIAILSDQHTAILDAIEAAAPAAAGQAAETHLQTSLIHRLKVLGQ